MITMIKYIKKIIKKRRLLKKYKESINACLFLLNKYNNREYNFYKKIEKHMLLLCTCYNRLKKL